MSADTDLDTKVGRLDERPDSGFRSRRACAKIEEAARRSEIFGAPTCEVRNRSFDLAKGIG